MNRDEFFSFLSLILAFKDVVIGEETLTLEEDLNLIENNQEEVEEEIPSLKENLFQIPPDSTEKNLDNSDNEELNPEEWDPW